MHAEVLAEGGDLLIGGAAAGEADHRGFAVVEMDVLDNGVSLDKREITDRDVFTQAVDQLGDSILYGAAGCHGGFEERVLVGGLRVPDHLNEVLDEFLEVFIVSDGLSFAADADEGTCLAIL